MNETEMSLTHSDLELLKTLLSKGVFPELWDKLNYLSKRCGAIYACERRAGCGDWPILTDDKV